MNATEDGDEPVGEAPEYVIIAAPPREALTSIPVLGENERQAIAEIREMHGDIDRDPDYPNIPPMCRQCFEYQPCDTNKALDKRGL